MCKLIETSIPRLFGGFPRRARREIRCIRLVLGFSLFSTGCESSRSTEAWTLVAAIAAVRRKADLESVRLAWSREIAERNEVGLADRSEHVHLRALLTVERLDEPLCQLATNPRGTADEAVGQPQERSPDDLLGRVGTLTER